MSNIYRLTDERSKSGKVIQVKPVHQKETTSHDNDSTEIKQQQIEELRIKAKQELDRAKEEANQLLSEAKLNIEEKYKKLEEQSHQMMNEAKDNGYQEGYSEGFKKGELEAERIYEELIKNAQELVQQTKNDYHEKLKEAENDIIKLTISSVEKILLQKMTEDQSTYFNIIKDSLEEVIHQPEVTLNVHPGQYKFLQENIEELEELFPNKGVLTIFPNKDLSENSCLIESPFGMIDSSIDTQLHQLKIHLTDIIKGEN
ncbi:flagellar assembly protein FliH [Filobacillus milosensis]|uniref:flagellar assembly protein FliH n=1 Tax=Filobacillus milosensis TaxID=94137 RepID=UPI001891B589|nr:flagellar assembly protein FliH [Filobacillus milosensis]